MCLPMPRDVQCCLYVVFFVTHFITCSLCEVEDDEAMVVQQDAHIFDKVQIELFSFVHTCGIPYMYGLSTC
ncbi:hypothetical protein F4774DRAFT_369449 [Daldinia eschscholtzii]|nr:hypothetical protein F4774DRAFT_369449 [Daldinia eschscholtzii]